MMEREKKMGEELELASALKKMDTSMGSIDVSANLNSTSFID